MIHWRHGIPSPRSQRCRKARECKKQVTSARIGEPIRPYLVMVASMHRPPDPPLKRRRGNPNMRIGAPSVNPSGRPKSYPELRALCQEKTIAGVERMEEILNDPNQPGSTRVAAWCALRDTGFDKPAQRIAFKDYTEHPAVDLPKDDLNGLADLYAAMIGATIDYRPSMIDVAPSQSLPAPQLSAPRQKLTGDLAAMRRNLRQIHEEEEAEKQHRGQPRQRERIGQPRQRERIERIRRP